MYKTGGKRLLDFTVASVGFIALFPIFLVVLILLTIVNQGKPFFFQKRPGKNGRIFSIVKFKTMSDKKDAKGNLLSDADRLTSVGSFVRKSSFDEIPQLLNVLKGDMSLIGPRPLLVEYLPLYSPRQKRRHEVRPGITGWAQVNGRNNLSWKERFEHDVFYVDHLSFALDMKIIFMTIKNVVTASDVNQEGSATMEKFTGQREQ